MKSASDQRLEQVRNSLQRALVEDGENDEVDKANGRIQITVEPDDHRLLQEFDKELGQDQSKGKTTHAIKLDSLLWFAKHRDQLTPNNGDNEAHGISLQTLLDEPVEERVLSWLSSRTTDDGEKLSQYTRYTIRSGIRQFGLLMAEDGRPPHIQRIDLVPPDWNPDPTPAPNTILYWDDHITSMLDLNGIRPRNAAICAVSWDSGGRPTEVYDRVVGDIEDNGDHIVFTINDGKTTDRDPKLVVSAPYLRLWLNKLNKLTDGETIPPSTPLWTHHTDPEQLSYGRFAEVTRETGRRAGIDRPTNPKQFRKSRASILAASPEVTEQALRIRFGWEPTSDVPRHYKARFDDKAEQQIANADGASIDLAEEHDDPAPVNCGTCGKWTPSHLSSCMWCEESISGTEESAEATIEHASGLQSRRAELMAELSGREIDRETMEIAVPLAQRLSDNPDIAPEAIAFTLATKFDVDPEFLASELEEFNGGGLPDMFGALLGN